MKIVNFICIILFIMFSGCKNDSLYDGASRVEGEYEVTHYIVDSDTLISPEKGNVSSYPHFKLKIIRENSDIVSIIYQTDSFGGGTGSPNIHLENLNEGYRLTMPENTINTDFGFADGKELYLNGAGWDIKSNKIFYTIIKGVKN